MCNVYACRVCVYRDCVLNDFRINKMMTHITVREFHNVYYFFNISFIWRLFRCIYFSIELNTIELISSSIAFWNLISSLFFHHLNFQSYMMNNNLTCLSIAVCRVFWFFIDFIISRMFFSVVILWN